PCGGGPVHAAELVADLVGPQGEELLAGAAEGCRRLVRGLGVVAGGLGEADDVVDARVDGELGAVGATDTGGGEPEGVAEDHLERSDGDDAASLGREPI